MGTVSGEGRHQKQRGRHQMGRHRKPLFRRKEGMGTQNGFSHCQKPTAVQKSIFALLPTSWMVPRVSQQEEPHVLVPMHKCTCVHRKRRQSGRAKQPSPPSPQLHHTALGLLHGEGEASSLRWGLFLREKTLPFSSCNKLGLRC